MKLNVIFRKNIKKHLKNKRKEKGITLIALVVTIVILLILTGVTLNMTLSDNGLFKKAKEAVEKYEKSSETEALEMSLMSYKLSENKEDESLKVGRKLVDRKLENGNTWDIIVEESNNKTYGTGWYYVEKGTDIEGLGKAKNSWLINYETGEMIELEEGNYISLSAGDALAIKDSLIINIDSSLIDKNVENKKESLEKQLGEGITLENFNYDDKSGLNSTSFNFDGENDYIKIEYDKTEQKEALANNGFTFEFYGTWEMGEAYEPDGRKIENPDFGGIFCYWNGNESKQATFRFGIQKEQGFLWNAGYLDLVSDFSQKNDEHNIIYDLRDVDLNNKIYVTVTLDTSEDFEVEGREGEYYKQVMYIDGIKKYEGYYNKGNWENFVGNEIRKLNYICIGRSSFAGDGRWDYSKMSVKCLRLYHRALSETEVMKNYEKTKEYHR